MDFTEIRSLQETTASEINDEEMTDETSKLSAGSPSAESPDQWATVIEPVTPGTLLDTLLAQLRSLATLAIVVAPAESSTLATLAELANPIIKHPYYTALLPISVLEEPNSTPTAAFLTVSTSASAFHSNQLVAPKNPQVVAKTDSDLAAAHFIASLADAEFRSHLLSMEAYQDRITGLYDPLLNPPPDRTAVYDAGRILCEYADALTSFAYSLTEAFDQPDTPSHRWTALTSAQNLLTRATNEITSSTASTTSEGPSKGQIYLQRGDIELQRWQLARLPSAASNIARGASVLLQNSGVFYRGAIGLAKQEGNQEVSEEASVKAAVVKFVQGGSKASTELKDCFAGIDSVVVEEYLGDMIADGLVNEDIRVLMGF